MYKTAFSTWVWQALAAVMHMDGSFPNGLIYRSRRKTLDEVALKKVGRVWPAREDLGETVKGRRADLERTMRAFA